MLKGAKHLAKRLVNGLHYHQSSDKKDLFVFSSFRSGSTWLTQILRSQPGVKFPVPPEKIPFLDRGSSEYQRLQNRPYFTSLSDAEQELVERYIRETSSGRSIHSRRYRDVLFGQYHDVVTNRSVYRMLRSNYLLDWYRDRFDIHAIFLLRHPIATSLSRKRIWENSEQASYWSPACSYFLSSEYVREQVLSAEDVQFLEELVNDCTALVQFVISWCLENLTLLRRADHAGDNGEFLLITYEDLLMNPGTVLDFLQWKLNLNDVSAMVNQLEKPSSTVKYRRDYDETHLFEGYNRTNLLKKWKRDVSDSEEDRVFEVIDRFDIDAYHELNFMPDDQYLMDDPLPSEEESELSAV